MKPGSEYQHQISQQLSQQQVTNEQQLELLASSMASQEQIDEDEDIIVDMDDDFNYNDY